VRTENGRLEVARLHASEWLLAGTDQGFAEADFRHISGRLTEPGERLSADELAAHLVFLARVNGYALRYELSDLEAPKASTRSDTRPRPRPAKASGRKVVARPPRHTVKASGRKKVAKSRGRAA
jgi:hypothetical protein